MFKIYGSLLVLCIIAMFKLWMKQEKVKTREITNSVVFKGHEGLVYSVMDVDTPQGKRLVSWSDDRTIRVWDLTGKEMALCAGHEDRVWAVRGIDTKHGTRLVSCSFDKTVRVWDLTGKEVAVCAG